MNKILATRNKKEKNLFSNIPQPGIRWVIQSFMAPFLFADSQEAVVNILQGCNIEGDGVLGVKAQRSKLRSLVM